jgi:hypothetical protein
MMPMAASPPGLRATRAGAGARDPHTTTNNPVAGFQTIIISPQKPLTSSIGHVAATDIPHISTAGTSTGKGVLIGMLSAFGTAAVVGIILLIIYFFNFTNRGRILLDRLGRPGEYDDEQQFAKDEAEALEEMDDMQRMEYMRAKGVSCNTGTNCARG